VTQRPGAAPASAARETAQGRGSDRMDRIEARAKGPKALAALAWAALCLTGCATQPAGDGDACHAQIAADGAAFVAGHGVERNRIAERLRSAGIRRDTAIRVAVSRDTPKSLLASVARELHAAGYGRVVFVTPRVATASARKQK
jgi:hypothetical protein